METKPFKCVMVIDDSVTDRNRIVRKMRKVNFAEKIIEMDSTIAALVEFNNRFYRYEEKPDVILVDMDMPSLDGMDFLQFYKLIPDIHKNRSLIYMVSKSRMNSNSLFGTSKQTVDGFLQKSLINENQLLEIKHQNKGHSNTL